MRLHVFNIITSKDRNSSVDIFRALAILGVIFYHFNFSLPYGYLGVDLFFVISGLLIGGLLTKQYKAEGKINYFKFILQRGFKIWPSYYFFLAMGSILGYFFYNASRPDMLIPPWDFKKFLFFYENYTGLPLRLGFAHVWSLCIEEHFYILLPILFLVVGGIFRGDKKWLFIFVLLIILSGILSKYLTFEFTHSKDTYSTTHCRIDALAWGVLLNLIITYYPQRFKSISKPYVFVFGLIIFGFLIILDTNFNSVFYNKVIFQSLIPVSFFLMISGVYFNDFSKWLPLRIIAYYSYNWYLWHQIFGLYIGDTMGRGIWGLVCFVLISFFAAAIATILIEEPFLKLRKSFLMKMYGSSSA